MPRQRPLSEQPARLPPDTSRYAKEVRIVRSAWPQAPTHFLAPIPAGSGSRGSKRSRSYVVREGHRFERKVAEHLADKCSSDWYLFEEFKFQYRTMNNAVKSAFVDLLAINFVEGKIFVIECKRSHTANSYKQIWRYMAYVRSYFGSNWTVCGFEVCLYQGLGCDYPGPHEWLYSGKLRGTDWDGRGLPKVGIVPWFRGKFYL